ncbi:hypothetical protein B566_EDAN002111 [Ephemera danica]|nr:hypothetical protein B566_EDAN002111 [Ephemera danica]
MYYWCVQVTNEYNDLEKEEVNIISGALEMREKTVADVMTRLEDVFMLSEDATLDFDTLNEIREQGYSRIPVHQKGKRSNITSILYTKDLAFVDSRLNMPVAAFCKFHPRDCNFIFGDTKLDVMLKTFREGNKGHMAFVTHVNTEGEGDPFYEVIGLVTLEDVIEEMIKAEIVDETDMWTDNRSKRRRERGNYDYGVFTGRREKQKYVLSPQLTLAAFQFLSTSVTPFAPELVSQMALRKMLEEDVNRHVKLPTRGRTINELPPDLLLYEKGKPADYFVLVLEGLVEVSIGESPMVVTPPSVPEAQLASFLPDYTVRAKTELAYLRIPVALYIAAVRATKMDRLREEKGEDLDITQFMLGGVTDEHAVVASPASELASECVSEAESQLPAVSFCSPEARPNNVAAGVTPPSPTESEGLLPMSTHF